MLVIIHRLLCPLRVLIPRVSLRLRKQRKHASSIDRCQKRQRRGARTKAARRVLGMLLRGPATPFL
eukprot:765782-Hanusia_phi.AAC.3